MTVYSYIKHFFWLSYFNSPVPHGPVSEQSCVSDSTRSDFPSNAHMLRWRCCLYGPAPWSEHSSKSPHCVQLSVQQASDEQLLFSISDWSTFSGSFAQALDLVWTPDPHVEEQSDQELQSLKYIVFFHASILFHLRIFKNLFLQAIVVISGLLVILFVAVVVAVVVVMVFVGSELNLIDKVLVRNRRFRRKFSTSRFRSDCDVTVEAGWMTSSSKESLWLGVIIPNMTSDQRRHVTYICLQSELN